MKAEEKNRAGKKWKRQNKASKSLLLEGDAPVTLDEKSRIYSYASVFQVEVGESEEPIYFQLVDAKLKESYQQIESHLETAEEGVARECYLRVRRGKVEKLASGSEAVVKVVQQVLPVVKKTSYQHPDESSPSAKTTFTLLTATDSQKPLPPYVVRRSFVTGQDSEAIRLQVSALKKQQLYFHEAESPLYFYQSEEQEFEDTKAVKFYTFSPNQGKDFFYFLKEQRTQAATDAKENNLTKISKALQLCLAMLEALQRFHQVKIHVHWDFKLENMLIQYTGDPARPWKITIIDCRGATPLPTSGVAVEEFAAVPSATTKRFSAPEVVKAQDWNEAIIPHTNQDVFSAGVVMKEILASLVTKEQWGVISLFPSANIFFSTIKKMQIKKSPKKRPTLAVAIQKTEVLLGKILKLIEQQPMSVQSEGEEGSASLSLAFEQKKKSEEAKLVDPVFRQDDFIKLAMTSPKLLEKAKSFSIVFAKSLAVDDESLMIAEFVLDLMLKRKVSNEAERISYYPVMQSLNDTLIKHYTTLQQSQRLIASVIVEKRNASLVKVVDEGDFRAAQWLLHHSVVRYFPSGLQAAPAATPQVQEIYLVNIADLKVQTTPLAFFLLLRLLGSRRELDADLCFQTLHTVLWHPTGNPDIKNSDGRTVCAQAVVSGLKLEYMQQLLVCNKNKNLSVPDQKEKTWMDYALERGHGEHAALLFTHLEQRSKELQAAITIYVQFPDEAKLTTEQQRLEAELRVGLASPEKAKLKGEIDLCKRLLRDKPDLNRLYQESCDILIEMLKYYKIATITFPSSGAGIWGWSPSSSSPEKNNAKWQIMADKLIAYLHSLSLNFQGRLPAEHKAKDGGSPKKQPQVSSITAEELAWLGKIPELTAIHQFYSEFILNAAARLQAVIPRMGMF